MNQDRVLRVPSKDFGLPAPAPVAVKDRGSAMSAVNQKWPAQTVFPDGWIATRSGRREIRRHRQVFPINGATGAIRRWSDREK